MAVIYVFEDLCFPKTWKRNFHLAGRVLDVMFVCKRETKDRDDDGVGVPTATLVLIILPSSLKKKICLYFIVLLGNLGYADL